MSDTEVDTKPDASPEDQQKDEVIRRYSAQVRIMAVQNKALSNLVIRQREQLRTLNNVIVRRKWATRKLRDYIHAVKSLHRPMDGKNLDNTKCRECVQTWPCRTNRAEMAVALDHYPALRKLVSERDHVHDE